MSQTPIFPRYTYTSGSGSQGSTGAQGATGAQGEPGLIGGSGLVLYYNYFQNTTPPYYLQTTSQILVPSPSPITFTDTTIQWINNPDFTNVFTISGGYYQSYLFLSGTGTIQITNITSENGTKVATNSNTIT